MKQSILLLVLLFSGCVNYTVLDDSPGYFRENIGPIHQELLNPLGLFFKGMVNPKDPNGTIHLYLLADSDTLLEEAFHSFEIRLGNNRKDEWEEFYYGFHSDGSTYEDYGGPILALAIITAVPFPQFIPGGEGFVNLYSRVSHLEDTASCFVALMHERDFPRDEIMSKKIDTVRRFVNGEYNLIKEKTITLSKQGENHGI